MELKCCPFCGFDYIVTCEQAADTPFPYWQAFCNRCFASVEASALDLTLEKWNERPLENGLIESRDRLGDAFKHSQAKCDALKLALEELAHYFSKIDGDPSFSDATTALLEAARLSEIEKQYKTQFAEEPAAPFVTEREEYDHQLSDLRYGGCN